VGLTGLTAVIGFAATPLILRWLGAERYGAFRAASDWLGYVGLLEFGIGGALQVLFARSLGKDDRVGVVATIRAGVRAYLAAAMLMAAFAAGLIAVLPELIHLPGELTGELRWGCVIYLCGLLLLPLAVFRALAEAGQRGYLVNALVGVQAVVITGGSVILARAGWGLVGQFAALILGALVFNLALAWDGLRRYPEALAAEAGRAGVGRSLWTLSWPTLIFNLSGRVGLLTDTIVIAGFLGPAAVAPFYLSQRLIALAQTQVQAVGSATWAGLIDLHLRGLHEVFARRFVQLTRLTALLGAASLLPVAVWNHDLIALWVGRDHYAGAAVTWLAAVNAWVLGVLSIWGWPLMAAGHVRSVLPAIIVSSALNIGVSLAATADVGLPGPLLGTTVALVLVSSWWTLSLLCRHFGVSARTLLEAALRPLVAALPYGAGLVFLARAVPAYDPSWPRWVCWFSLAGWLVVGAVGYLVLAWFLVVPTADRTEWIGRLRGWVARR
jgi:O-antigen/teichoic acid export membrane protein